MKKAFIAGFLFLSILFVSAPNVGAITIAELQAQINSLMAQLTALQAQQGTATTGPTTTTTNTGGKFQIGDSIIVTQDGLNVRATPYGTTLGSHQLSARGTIKDGPQKSRMAGDNTNWWNVNYQDGVNGWSIESGLKKVNNTTNNGIKYVSFLFPIGGETLVKGQTYYFRFTGRDIGITNYDVYLYDGRNGPPPYTGPYDYTGSGCSTVGCSVSSAQTLIGHTSRTDKDVDVFAWTVPTNLESKQGYQIHLVNGNNTSRNVTGAWSGAVTIADNTTTTTSGSTVTLYVDGASTVTKGSPVILRFSANNVSYCVGPDTLISPNIQNSINGFNTVYPIETTIYSIHCYRTTPTTMNATNNPDASASVTITVGQTSVVTPTVSLSINSSFGSGSNTATVGSYKVLNWSSTNATTCTASGIPGSWNGPRAISGSESVGPINQTTAYTITCYGSGLSQSATVTINVAGQTPTTLLAPTVTFSASPTSITAGQPVTLSWSSTNATFCGAGSGWGGQKGLSGSEVVYPTTSLNYYYITCTGNGQANANVTITIIPTSTPLTTLDFSANKTLVVPGEAVSLILSAKNANFCNFNADGQIMGWQSNALSAGASVYYATVYPTKTTIYTATCYNSLLGGVNGPGSGSQVIVTTSPSTSPTVDLKINNSDGPLSISSGQSIYGNWTTGGVGACVLYTGEQYWSGVEAGIGSFSTISPGHSLYPTTFPKTFKVTCKKMVGINPTGDNVSDSVTLNSQTISTPTPTTNDPSTDPNYSQTSSVPLSNNEKTVSYTYPSNPCGGLMTSYTAPGSVSVGNGPVYASASTACAPNTPNTTTFRVYSCRNALNAGVVQGTATFAFQCNPTTSSANTAQQNYASVYESLRALLQQLSNQIVN